RRGDFPGKVYAVDVSRRRKEVLREIRPSDSAGVQSVGPILLSRDGKSYVASYIRNLSDLHVVEGLR
ncbi:MAG TPA: hypothetical protein VGK70_07210, partial [Thermoanaerobaculia bacterium]